MRSHLGLLLLPYVLLAGCGGELSEPLQSGHVMGIYGLEGRWAGPVVPVQAGCGSTSHGLMSIGSGGFAFDPFQGTSVIKGEMKDARLTGTLVRQGPDHKDLSLQFEAASTSTKAITGTLRSGRCEWQVMLNRG